MPERIVVSCNILPRAFPATNACLEIAVDFGTTFSAIGYAKYNPEDSVCTSFTAYHVTRCPNLVQSTNVPLHIIQDGWPGQSLERSPKIPTCSILLASRLRGTLILY